jgi:glyoxylase I family protein
MSLPAFFKNIRGQHHTALRVSDWDKSMAFYNAMGFEILVDWPEADGIHMAMIQGPGGGRIEMFTGGHGHIPEDVETINGSYFQFCFDVPNPEDVDKLYEYALSIGATKHWEPASFDMKGSDDSVIRAAFVHGPDGELIEFLSLRFV